jgi:hypothetical protein
MLTYLGKIEIQEPKKPLLALITLDQSSKPICSISVVLNLRCRKAFSNTT